MRLRVAVILCALSTQWSSLFTPLPARAESAPPNPSGLLISELQVAGPSSASDEFVELYNPSANPVDLKNYQLEYHSASTTSDCSTGWTTKSKVAAGTIPSHGFYLFTSRDHLPAADQTFASGLASAGSLRLVATDGGVVDTLAWGTGKCGLGTAALAPAAGHSLERRPGADLETAGNAYDTGDNAADFMLRATPGPQSSTSAPEVPAADYVPTTPAAGSSAGSSSPVNPSDAAPLELNELLPDPAAPLTDAADEFIELYNPNPYPINIAGYVVKTGASLSIKHTLVAGTVPAGGYLALKSATTKVALSNSGSSVALFDPAGHQVGATVTWPKAKTGAAWARADDAWVWTTTSTPSAANIITEATSGMVAGSSTSKTSKSTTKAKAASTAKPKTTKAKTSKAKTTKSANVSNKTTDPAAAGTTPGGRWLLFALAGLTIAYIIYEFRYDLQNFYFKLRGYPGRGRTAGPAA